MFTSGYIEELHHIGIRMGGDVEAQIARISTDIFDRLGLEDRWREDLKKNEEKEQDTEDEKARLLIQAGNLSEELLQKSFLDIKGMFEQKGRAETRLVELERDLQDLKTQDADLHQKFNELNPQSSQVKVYRDVHRVLEEISKAFKKLKKKT